MYITSFDIENFRNIEKMRIEPCDGVNVIYGENAQGKTNLIEAMWIMSGYKSFRGINDKEMLRFGQKAMHLKVEFGNKEYCDNEIKLDYAVRGGRKYNFNGSNISRRGDNMGNIYEVVFSPTHLNLIKQGPAERRKFLDTAISQLKVTYTRSMRIYNRSMKNRNALLIDAQYDTQKHDMLGIWEEQMAETAAYMAFHRMNYINKLNLLMKDIYKGISQGKEEIELRYVQAFGSGRNFCSKEDYIERFVVARKGDVNIGTTSCGIHKDDLEILINGKSARKYASQGQQRTAALAMKLAEAKIIEGYSGQSPILLLDDVMSELDPQRQDYVLNQIKDWQVFITCCDPTIADSLKEGRCFEIANGKIISVR